MADRFLAGEALTARSKRARSPAMMEVSKRAALSEDSVQNKKKKTSWSDLPAELEKEIAMYVMNNLNGSIIRAARGESDPETHAAKRVTRRQTKEEDERAAKAAKFSMLYVNKKMNSTANDVLFWTNTMTLTSAETKELLESPGLTKLLTNLRIYERNAEESIFTAGGKAPWPQNMAMIREILSVSRLQSLSIDVEPFFVSSSTEGSLYIVWQDGLMRFLRSFGLAHLALWRCDNIGHYTLIPLVAPQPLPKGWHTANDPTPDQLHKVTLCTASINQTLKHVRSLSPTECFNLTLRHWLPHVGSLNPEWFGHRPADHPDRKHGPHRFSDWLIRWRVGHKLTAPGVRAQWNAYLSKHVGILAYKGADDLDFARDKIIPLHDKHRWTVIFVKMKTEAKRMALREGH